MSLPDFQLDFSHSPWWLVALAALSLGLTWWMYRHIQIQVPSWVRITAATLRFVALFILLVLLIEPLLTLVSQDSTPPIVVFLQDATESMLAHRDSAYVQNTYAKDWSQLKTRMESAQVDFHTYTFGKQLEPLNSWDSLRFDETGTDISGALDRIVNTYANQNLGAIIMATDGIPTSGKNPIHTIEEIPAPVFTVLLGDTVQPRDLLIEAVNYNQLSYVNTITPIQVHVRAEGIDRETVEVKLLHKGRVIDGRTLNLSQTQKFGQVTFEVELDEAGLQPYVVVLNRLEDEVSYLNNQENIYIKVLETRLRVGLFAGGPHPDIGALKKSLLRDDRYELHSHIRKTESSFYHPPTEWGRYELFILHNFPSGPADRPVMEQILEQCRKRKIPILHLIGNTTSFQVHPDQKQYTAVYPERTRSTTSEAFMYLTADYQNHATYRFEDADDFNTWMSTAPPLLRNDSEWKSKTGAKVFGKARIKGIALNYPMLVMEDKAGQKNIVLLGEGLWRYRMHAYLKTESFEVFDVWLYNMIQWLTTRSDTRRFRVFPTKSFFEGDERVVFRGQVYDEANNPVEGAEIQLSITDEADQKTDYFLKESPAGNYQLLLSNLEQGSYRYQAMGIKNGERLGQDQGEFSVGRSAIEFVQLKANQGLLKQVALRTRGAFAPARNLDALADSVLNHPALKPMIEYRKSTRSLNRLLWPLMIALTCLGLEWILRKRFGLI